jgi:hypothetical protein
MSKNGHYFFFPLWTGLRIALLALYCGNNLETDMLEQYGDLGTK